MYDGYTCKIQLKKKPHEMLPFFWWINFGNTTKKRSEIIFLLNKDTNDVELE